MNIIQIDVKKINPDADIVACNLYTGERCVKFFMKYSDYRDLQLDGFFIRSGDELDSANVLNTTNTYKLHNE